MVWIDNLLAIALPAHSDAENFGMGSMKAKIINLLLALFLTDFIATFRTAIA